MAQAPGLWTIGGESHDVIEGIPKLHPSWRGWESNCLTAEDADVETARLLGERFLARLRNRDGQRPPGGTAGLRFLEKTPRNVLRIPFLATAFPDALFLHLYRDPLATVSSMLDFWRSRRAISYPRLPGWEGPPWSLLLVPAWQELRGKSLAEIVARQWAAATSRLLDDLEALPLGRRVVVTYDHLVSDPQSEIRRLCGFIGVDWDRELTVPLRLSRSTLTPPAPEKWRHNREELDPVIPLISETAQRARDFIADSA
jgi:hypothetical protein